METNCPTCGSRVKVHNSDEGTGYFEPLESKYEAFWNWAREADKRQFDAECELSEYEHKKAMEAQKELGPPDPR